MIEKVFVSFCKHFHHFFFLKIRDGDFVDFSTFADFFSVLPIFRISADFYCFELSAL